MRKGFILLILSVLHIFFCNIIAQTSNLTLREVLNVINAENLKSTVQDMQNFESRLCTKTIGQNRKVAQYLVDRLKTYGIENAHIDSFYVSGFSGWAGNYAQYMYNVLGTLQGTGGTDSTVIIGAHLDAIATKPDNILYPTAPGADDNATGCAVMIEMARLLHEKNIQPFHNIDFMAFDAEEIGLLGAYYDARKRKAANENIIVMLNNDMVGNQPEDEIWEVSLRWYTNSLDITEKAEHALYKYTRVIPVRTDFSNSSGSDSYAYFEENYKVHFAIEKNFSPHYHSENDLTENLNFEYCGEIAKMNFVLLDYYAGINLPLSIKPGKNGYDHSIAVFPNPATEVIRIHSYNEIIVSQIDIYDISGKLMKSYKTNGQQHIIYLDNLSRGIYFLRIYTDQGILNKKIIKK